MRAGVLAALGEANRGGGVQGRPLELVALDDQVATVDDKVRAFFNAEVHVAAHFFEMRLRHERPHVVVRIGAVADLHRRDATPELVDDGVRGLVTNADSDGDRHAAFAA